MKKEDQSKRKELIKLINSLNDKDFPSLKPYHFPQGNYTIGLITKGYLDTSYIIANLLKVCLLALEADTYSTRLIPEPEHNIKEVLGYILDLIPHDEMEILDSIRYLTIDQEKI
ncbi:hypothetical protein HX109_12565 [Galbibacter sp. BG1]|uniref:hypothetical protein n=1 Tax=Galbibacter sp. BG1 TaxID=1170699 RepID=UPI0015BE06B8|nr:hypothetical protein [Galbibacter sp. BG1]QLE02349.1 hypothetical protein HX109_12565 [Galbibacter sp. BG1]